MYYYPSIGKGWPEPGHEQTESTLKPQRKRKTSTYFEKIWKYVWWNTGYVENRSGRFGIKVWRDTSVLVPLSSTEGTQGNFQKGSLKNTKIRYSQIVKLIRMGSTLFCPTKQKTNCVIFLSDFRNLNRQLKRKPYPMPKICQMLLNLKGFQYATSLYLNMGYYHISLSDQASNLCTIILL